MALYSNRTGRLPEVSSRKSFVPIYQRLVELYKHDILDQRLKAGDRIDSISQIESKHRVSRETAKRVLNILAEEGFVVQFPGKGSFVADLRPKQPYWGLVYPFSALWFDDLMLRLGHYAHTEGRELRVFCDYNNWQEEIRLVGQMLNERYEAIIVIPTPDETLTWDFYSRLSPMDSPVIIFDHTMSYNDFTFVIQSYDLGVVRAIKYLLGRKDGSVVLLQNALWPGRNMVLELMIETYREVLRRQRPDLEPLILSRASDLKPAYLSQHGVTGVFACDDVSAVRAIGTLKEHGIEVPGHINVVSYGNSDLARYFTPAITSVDPHRDEMISGLIKLLEPCIEGQSVPQLQYVVQPELVVRMT